MDEAFKSAHVDVSSSKRSDFIILDTRYRYTDNPRKNPEAKPVKVVRDIQKIREEGECLESLQV